MYDSYKSSFKLFGEEKTKAKETPLIAIKGNQIACFYKRGYFLLCGILIGWLGKFEQIGQIELSWLGITSLVKVIPQWGTVI